VGGKLPAAKQLQLPQAADLGHQHEQDQATGRLAALILIG
jgi:hypothetical protein